MSSFNTDTTSKATPAEAFNFNDFEAEGESILAAAQAEAQSIKSSVEAEKQAAIAQAIEKAKKEGYAAGFEEGKNDGYSAGLQQGRDEIMPQITPSIATFDNAATKLEATIDGLLQQAQSDFIELVKVVALKVIHKNLEGDATIIAGAMESIADFITQKNSLIINLNPEDRAMATQWLRDNKGRFDKLKSLKINEDETVSRGGCTITTPEGGIDVTIETAIAAIVEEL